MSSFCCLDVLNDDWLRHAEFHHSHKELLLQYSSLLSKVGKIIGEMNLKMETLLIECRHHDVLNYGDDDYSS